MDANPENRQGYTGFIGSLAPQLPTRRTSLQSSYPEANQLLLGNLPPNVTEQEIKKVFRQYGQIAIHWIKHPPGRFYANPQVMSSALISLDDPGSAQAALKKGKFWMGNRRYVTVKSNPADPGGPGGGGHGGFNRDGSTGAGHAGVSDQGSNIGGGSGHGRGYGNYGDQRGSAPTHSRTFRGTNRAGGNQNAGGDRGGPAEDPEESPSHCDLN